jgi:DNA repair protein RecN (Recombination protein N)
MLQLLSISNIALIDDLRVEFDGALNLLTGETGSGKSIIVDALGVLIGGRFTSEMLKSGAERGSIEGLFSLGPNPQLRSVAGKLRLLKRRRTHHSPRTLRHGSQQDLHQQSACDADAVA